MRCLDRPLVLVLILIGTAGFAQGCGDDIAEPGGERLPASDENLIRAAVHRYDRALEREDWKAACALLSTRDREGLAQVAGSCERGFAGLFRGQELPGAVVFDIQVDGDSATYRIRLPGTEIDLTNPVQDPVEAVKENGEWRLQAPLG